ncbi:polygalacturonase-like [Anoplophora glabripennis]|uniref:polygalacturonase-like n=1 Tax=Anoplophora glabripennis TaxID=217634 RepID=UPI000874F901|nr:polygalacturonase-like [Anoplophora glabripennis]
MGHFLGLFVLLLTAVACHSASQNVTAVSCTISKYNADHIKNAQNECSDIIIDGIIVPYGVTLDLTSLKSGTKVIFQGTLAWEYSEWGGPLIKIKGTNVEITGADNHVLDGRGALWWDGLGGNGGKVKPKFLRATVTNSVIRNLHIKNAPINAVLLSRCVDSVIEYITIDDKDGDKDKAGHNTDAFNLNSNNNITIQHCTVYNQDDCMAINFGQNTYFLNNYCSGGHGISIGSVGGGSEVKGVLVDGCQIVDSDNGVRIKTKYGQTGSVSDITYQNIVLKNIHNYGIIMQGDYGSKEGVPTGGVPISHLTLKNISGTVDKTGVNIYILVANASDWHWSDINVTGGEKKMECQGIPAGTRVSC